MCYRNKLSVCFDRMEIAFVKFLCQQLPRWRCIVLSNKILSVTKCFTVVAILWQWHLSNGNHPRWLVSLVYCCSVVVKYHKPQDLNSPMCKQGQAIISMMCSAIHLFHKSFHFIHIHNKNGLLDLDRNPISANFHYAASNIWVIILNCIREMINTHSV